MYKEKLFSKQARRIALNTVQHASVKPFWNLHHKFHETRYLFEAYRRQTVRKIFSSVLASQLRTSNFVEYCTANLSKTFLKHAPCNKFYDASWKLAGCMKWKLFSCIFCFLAEKTSDQIVSASLCLCWPTLHVTFSEVFLWGESCLSSVQNHQAHFQMFLSFPLNYFSIFHYVFFSPNLNFLGDLKNFSVSHVKLIDPRGHSSAME